LAQTVTPIGVTREYERFHDELGRLDANQGATKLWDAIYEAGKMANTYYSNDIISHLIMTPSDQQTTTSIVKRVFVLTDGEDNASSQAPWHVAQYLQQNNIILDAIPLAGHHRVLQSLCTASGGCYFEVYREDQAMALFESEATLHVPYREEYGISNSLTIPRIVDIDSLKALEKGENNSNRQAVTVIRSAPSKTASATMMTAQSAQQLLAQQSSTASLSSSSISTSPPSSTVRGAALRRLLKEYNDCVQ